MATTRTEFFAELRERLSGLPQAELDERLSFYGEMLDDRIEDGLSEEEALRDIGSVEEIAEQIIADVPLLKIAKKKIKPQRRLRAWEITLIAVGSPIWLSLLISLFAIVISLCAVLWTLVVSAWAVFAVLVGSALGGVIAGIATICTQSLLSGLFFVGCGICCGGLAIFAFFGSLAATKGAARLCRLGVLMTKKIFVGRGKA